MVSTVRVDQWQVVHLTTTTTGTCWWYVTQGGRLLTSHRLGSDPGWPPGHDILCHLSLPFNYRAPRDTSPSLTKVVLRKFIIMGVIHKYLQPSWGTHGKRSGPQVITGSYQDHLSHLQGETSVGLDFLLGHWPTVGDGNPLPWWIHQRWRNAGNVVGR